MKKCGNKSCKEKNPEFYKDASRRDGLSSWCKECSKTKNIAYHASNREKILARQKNYAKSYVRKPGSNRKSYLKSRYGITIEQYNELYEKQKGCCAICGKKKPLRVDHNHKTKKVRKLLCHHCNIGIGEFYEKPNLLKRALRYLEEHA